MSLPSLLLIPDRYKATKLYSQLPQSGAGDMAVTRATTATRVNPAGLIEVVGINVPRIDYTGGGCPSLLVEQSATNVLPQNMNFAAWTAGTNAVAADSSIASPVVGFNYARVTANVGTFTVQQRFYLGVTFALDNLLTYFTQVRIQKGTSRYVMVRIAIADYSDVIDLDTNTITRSGGTLANKVASVLIDMGDHVLYVTELRNAALCFPVINLIKDPLVFIGANGSPAAETFNGTETVRVTGGQLEVTRRTSLIVTGAAAVTRSADIVTLAGATDLIGQTEGTIFVEILYDASVNNRASFGAQPLITVGTNSNNSTYIQLRGAAGGGNSNRVIGITANGGVTQAQITSAPQVTGIVKIAYTYAVNSFKLFVNGVKVGEDLLGTVPTGGDIFFGHFDASGALFTIRLNAASLEKIVISEAEAIALTTI